MEPDLTSGRPAPADQPLPSADTYTLFCHDLPSTPRPEMGKVLVTGASGYIGGRLVPELLARGYEVRVMVRGRALVYAERWPGVEVVVADALDRESLDRALAGVAAAYYLIHSLRLGPREFESADITAARNFREAAQALGVGRIIYLGGLGDCRLSRSRHLQCRMQVAEELQDGAVPVTILRAAVIIGSGSASYEIIRALASRAPVLPMPHWARNLCQPIGVRDVIKYLVGVLETPETADGSFDIGGPDVLTYERMVQVFAEVINKKLITVAFPFSSIRLYAYAASFLTPVPAPIIACLMEGLKDEVVCGGEDLKKYLPFAPLPYREAIVRALTREEQDRVHTRWSDAYPPASMLAIRLSELAGRPLYTASFSLLSDKAAADIFRSICRVGGKAGWFDNNWMWRMRGMLDRALSGVGTARGRKSQSTLQANDVIDFWRVEEIERDHRLLLRAEMKLPGRAWLEFNLAPENGRRRLSITAFFQTRTIFGRAYWYAFLPFHRFIFKDLIEEIERRS
ncbi:MAG TPA: SDR family oxidoreductase [bacterium]|nr:SDR family oxidoreductase [bacterium]